MRCQLFAETQNLSLDLFKRKLRGRQVDDERIISSPAVNIVFTARVFAKRINQAVIPFITIDNITAAFSLDDIIA